MTYALFLFSLIYSLVLSLRGSRGGDHEKGRPRVKGDSPTLSLSSSLITNQRKHRIELKNHKKTWIGA